MKINSNPAQGMRDILPNEAELRNFLTNKILDVYKKHGFSYIESPCIEKLNLLCSGEGGENEKLIFKILKRGEKIKNFQEYQDISDLTDLGLRYDLTVPLVRYYINNVSQIPTIFKSIQISPVWRAERPQKGRFRQFTQCDIDIIGEKGEIAEIELLIAGSCALLECGLKNFEIKINNREILKQVIINCGFDEKDFEDIVIIIDKIDKISHSGVEEELLSKNFDEKSIEKILSLLSNSNKNESLEFLSSLDNVDDDAKEKIKKIIKTLNDFGQNNFSVYFDLSLARGMSYYTGTIFEISYKDYPFSIAGGGRYDDMIKKISKNQTPACGFSIGFERILLIIQEENLNKDAPYPKLALIIENKEEISKIIKFSQELQEKNFACSWFSRPKNLKNLLNELKKNSYTHFCIFDEEAKIKSIT